MSLLSPRFAIALALGVLLPTIASALDASEANLVDSTSIEVPNSFSVEDGITYVGIDGCERMLANEAVVTATWNLAFSPANEGAVIEEYNTFSVSRGNNTRIDCSSGELCAPISDDDIDFGDTSVSAQLDFATLLGNANQTECTGFDLEFFARLTLKETIGGETTDDADAKFIVDTSRPTAPSGLTATATENRVTVTFDASPESDVDRYFVFYSATGFEGGALPGDVEATSKVLGDSTSGDVSIDVSDADSIFVAVAAQDLNGNFSPLSGVVSARIIATNDFWESYRTAGGEETGGCSTTSAGSSPLAALFVVFGLIALGRRRRERYLVATLFALALVATPLTASADTPTWGALEIKLGSYYPAIDEEFGGSGPFGETFGSDNLLMGELELDGWIWQGFGKLGVGAHIGFSRVKGNAQAADPDEQSEVSDTTSFGIIPIRGSLIYRFDWLAQHTAIPLSASVKLGPDFYRWRIADGTGDTAEFDGDTASGWKTGWHFAANLQLLLDVIDPGTAAAFDLAWGVNNSYLFAELMMTRVDDFGGDGFDLSDNIWLFGLSFEF